MKYFNERNIISNNVWNFQKLFIVLLTTLINASNMVKILLTIQNVYL